MGAVVAVAHGDIVEGYPVGAEGIGNAGGNHGCAHDTDVECGITFAGVSFAVCVEMHRGFGIGEAAERSSLQGCGVFLFEVGQHHFRSFKGITLVNHHIASGVGNGSKLL